MNFRALVSPRVLAVACSLLLAAWGAGCEYDDDDDFDHDPPAGKGTLFIQNDTAHGMNVFIDGAQVSGVGDDETKHYDLDPGAHRLVLDENHGDRQFHDDIDILADRKTILEVSTDPGDLNDYDVFIRFK